MPARAWIELPDGAAWGEVRLAAAALGQAGYVTEEVRGGGRVWLRLSGARLDPPALWIMPEP